MSRRSRDWAYTLGAKQQIEVPSLYADSYAVRNSRLLGGVVPHLRGRMQQEHGRFLNGFGGESPDGQVGYDPYYQDESTYDLESQDDVYGSGIFDPGGRSGTSNANMGVFASHYSLPGYVARDVPFTVSRDVSDITQDAEVVSVPAGGLWAVEHRGKLQRPAVLGPTWQPKALTPAGVTRRDQPYAFLTRPEQPVSPPLNPGAPVTAPPSYHPGRNPTHWSQEVPQDRPTCQVPRVPAQHGVPRKMTVQPQPRSIVVDQPGCAGFGQEEEEKQPATPAQLLFAGAVAGAAAGIAMAVVGGKKGAR